MATRIVVSAFLHIAAVNSVLSAISAVCILAEIPVTVVKRRPAICAFPVKAQVDFQRAIVA